MSEWVDDLIIDILIVVVLATDVGLLVVCFGWLQGLVIAIVAALLLWVSYREFFQ